MFNTETTHNERQRDVHVEYSRILQSLYELKGMLTDTKQNKNLLKQERELIIHYHLLIAQLTQDINYNIQ